MGAEDLVEDMGEEGCRPLGKMLQCPIRNTVRARSPADVGHNYRQLLGLIFGVSFV